MTKFETGKTYRTRFIGDSDSKIDVTIERRTAKTVWFIDPMDYGNGRQVKSARVTVRDGVEEFFPTGRYSMAPVIKADRLAA